MAQPESRPAVENTAETFSGIRNWLKNTTETTRRSVVIVQQSIDIGEEARATARGATEVGRAIMEMTRGIEGKELPS